ncbi:MAG TPA: DNA mismatch repair protein MutS [Acidobacteriota bacterium]
MPADSISPMVRQYQRVKSAHPGAILLFRLGDFYEMFYDDAVVASELLELTLTARHRGKPNEMPMCGFPHRAASTYIGRLIRAGKRVAICDQVEDPKQAKGVVDRAVVRVVTPGTATDDDMLEADQNNYLAALVESSSGAGAALLDLSTGELIAAEAEPEEGDGFIDRLLRYAPRELLAAAGSEGELLRALRRELPGVLVTEREAYDFELERARRELEELFSVRRLEAFGLERRPHALRACGALLLYGRDTQKAALAHIHDLRLDLPSEAMLLDASTVRHLELIRTWNEGKRQGSLLDLIDQTLTSMGGRMLQRWLLRPLAQLAPILKRQEAVAELVGRGPERAALREQLRGVADLQRLLGRVSLGSATPRDLGALRDSAARLPRIAAAAPQPQAPRLAELLEGLSRLAELEKRLAAALADEPPALLQDGGVIRGGYDAEIDRLRAAKSGARQTLAELEARERKRTGIPSLKLRYNQVFGYAIEVTKTHLAKVPAEYERKQTLASAERFTTAELRGFEAELLGADEKLARCERELFEQLRAAVAAEGAAVAAVAESVAELDVLQSLAEVAARYDYCRPRLHEGPGLKLIDGRHPTVERIQRDEPFVPNDLELAPPERRMVILTGPNMGGKSTYLRQVALTAILAQIGGYVPAREAELGLVDRVFTRVGAGDNLIRGQSTFLVEMSETAYILRQATGRSLVLLDEIGRGTATFDGLSLAWAVAEHLLDDPRLGCKTLFATHYHELTELALTRAGVCNMHVAVREWGDRIVFLRKVVAGPADRSYGVQVARLAGLPDGVVERAREILANLERGELDRQGRPRLAQHAGAPAAGSASEPQLPLYGPEYEPHPVIEELKGIEPEQLTPLEALNLLARLADKAKN